MTLDVTKVPSIDTAKEVLGWYATLFGGKPDLFLGGAFVAAVLPKLKRMSSRREAAKRRWTGSMHTYRMLLQP